jgi:hypothetical protein
VLNEIFILVFPGDFYLQIYELDSNQVCGKQRQLVNCYWCRYLNKLNIAVEVNLDAVDDENIDVLSLVQQQHRSQIADSLIYTKHSY